MEGEIERISIVTGIISYPAVVLLSPDTDRVYLVSQVMIIVIDPIVVARDRSRGPCEVLSAPGRGRTETSTIALKPARFC